MNDEIEIIPANQITSSLKQEIKLPTTNIVTRLTSKTSNLNLLRIKTTLRKEQSREINRQFKLASSLLEKCTSLFYIIYLTFFVSIIFMQFDVEKRFKIRQTLLEFFVNGITEEIIIKEEIIGPLLIFDGLSKNTILDDKYEIVGDVRLTLRRMKIINNAYPIMPLVTDTGNTINSQWASRGIGHLDSFHPGIEDNGYIDQNLIYSPQRSFFGKGGYVFSYNIPQKKEAVKLDNFINYLNIQTACVTLDLVLINYELNYTCTVAIANEFSENGVIKKKFYLYMTNRNLYSSDWEYARATFELIALISFILYVVFYAILLKNKINAVIALYPNYSKFKLCFNELIGNFFNLFQCISILMTIIIIILWAAYSGLVKSQSVIVNNVYKSDQRFSLEQQNDMFYCGYFFEVYRGFATVNFLFIFARLMEIVCKLIPSTSVFVDTISIAMSDIFSYFIFFICMLLGFSFLSWIFFCRWLDSFGTFSLSFQQNWVFSLGIMNSNLFYEMYKKDSPMTVIYFIVFIIFMRFFICKILLGIILYYFSKVHGTYLMEKELSLVDEYTEANIKPKIFYKVILTYSRLLNTLCDWAICKCRKKRKMAVEVDYSEVSQFNAWTIKHYLCPEIKIKKDAMKDDNSNEQGKIRKVSGMQLYELNYNENYEFTVRNAYFDSEKDFEKVKCYFELKHRKTVIHFLLYLVFTIFLIVMYLMNCLTPWRWNFYSYFGDTLSNITHTTRTDDAEKNSFYTYQSNKKWNSSLLKQFVFEDFLNSFSKNQMTFAFIGNNFVLGNKLLFTTKKELKEESVTKSINARQYEILNDYKLYKENKEKSNTESAYYWNYYTSYREYGGYNFILDLTNDPQRIKLNDVSKSFLDDYTAFTFIEFFLQNYEYEVGIYVKLKITSDYGAYYILDYQTSLIKYNTLQMPIDGAKYASEFFFILLLIYLIVVFFQQILQESRNYNKWFHDVILPLNLKIKDLRNRAEPELLRKIAYMISMPRIIDLSVLCLSIGLLACRIQLWVYENKLNTNLKEHQEKAYENSDMYQLRDLFYSGIYAKNNYEIIGCILIFLVLMKYISLLDFGQYLSVLKRTFENSQYNSWTFIIILIFIHPAFVFYAHLCFGEKDIQYYKVESSIHSILKIFCGYIDYMNFYEANKGLGPLFYFIYFIIINMILLNLFIAIISTSYDKIKDSIIKTNSVYDWRKVLCFCSKLRYKKELPYTLEAEFEYENQIPKYDTGFHITGEKKTVFEWVKYESDQIKRIDDALFQIKKKKNDMDLAIESSKAEQEFVFEDNLYKNIQYSHYRSFYVYYLNYMLTIAEKIEKDIIMLDQSSKHLTEHDEYMNYDMMLENVDKKHNKILAKIAEVDKNFVDMKNDLNKIHALSLETYDIEKEAKKKKNESEKKKKEKDNVSIDSFIFSQISEEDNLNESDDIQ